MLLYGVPSWDPLVSVSAWKNLESVRKAFLLRDLSVRPQVPYIVAGASFLPLEAEGLHLTLKYVPQVRNLGNSRLPFLALRAKTIWVDFLMLVNE